MIKVVWLLQRNPNLTLEQFRTWWIDDHAHLVARMQQPQLRKYSITVRLSDDDELAGRPSATTNWDGFAEQWFDNEHDFNEVYGRAKASVTRDDTDAHVAQMARVIATQHDYV